MGSARLQQTFVEALTTGVGSGRLQQMFVEMLASARSEARVEQVFVEVLSLAVQTYNEGPTQSITYSQTAVGTVVHNPLTTNTLSITGVANLTNAPTVPQTFSPTGQAIGSLVLSRTVPQTFSMSDMAGANQTYNLSVPQTLTLTDIANKVAPANAENTLTITQTALGPKFTIRLASQTLTISQLAEHVKTSSRTIGQGFVIGQSATKTISRLINVPQTFAPTQSVPETNAKLGVNTLTMAQDAEVTVGKHVRQTLTITQVGVGSMTYTRPLFSVFIPGQVVIVNLFVNKSVSQTLTFTQNAIGFVVKPTSNTLTITQTISVISTKPAFSTLIFSQTPTFTRSIGVVVSQLFSIDDELNVIRSFFGGGSNIFSMAQFAKATKVYTVSASNTLVMTHDVVGRRYIRPVVEEFPIFQSVSVQKYINVEANNEFDMTENLGRLIDYNFDISDELVFLHNFNKPIGNGQFVSVPEVQVVKVRSTVVLESDIDAIVLPSPEFNDRIGDNTKLNIKRSMDGERYIYKRTTDSSRLAYDFVIDRVKALELRDFILPNNSKLLRMENWKGEIWMVHLTNNPFSTSEEARWESANNYGNKCRITLEFEGVRIN